MRLRTKYTQRLPTATGLVLDIPLFEGSGEIAHDLSGKGNEGSITGASWSRGEKGVCLDFDGINDYVDCGNNDSLDFIDKFSMESWCTFVDDDLNIQSYISKGKYNDAVSSFVFEITRDHDRFSLSIKDVYIYKDDVVNYGSNCQMFFRYKKDSLGILYSNTVAIVTMTTYNISIPITTHHVFIGCNKDIDHDITGIISKVRLYNILSSVNTMKRRYEQPDHDYCRGS